MADINDKIAEHTGLIYARLQHYCCLGNQDAESAAYEALWRAAETYKENSGCAFSTYAVVCINNAIGKYIRHTKRKKQLQLVSLEQECFNDGENDAIFVADFIPDEDTPYTVLMRRGAEATLEAKIPELMNNFSTPLQKKVIEAWLAHEDRSISSSALAKEVGTSQPNAFRIIERFKHMLREELEEYL